MMHRDNTINLAEAAVGVRFDSDAKEAIRPISLRVLPFCIEHSARAFILTMSLDEAADIANCLLDSVAFAKRVQKGSGGDL